MSPLLELDQVGADARSLVGGKAAALARLAAAGVAVPPTLCLTTRAYRDFVDGSGLGAVIELELGRKPLTELRWEELWDIALRIRAAFVRTAVPPAVAEPIVYAVEQRFGDRPLAIRSSAPGEDSAQASFAGLHESFVGVVGGSAAVDHVVRVWASLWSDRALLYRRELGLDARASAMAVVIQELVEGSASGVAFGVDPTEPERMVVEAVHGLNQGLVDGTVEPDRWLLARSDGRILEHRSPGERRCLRLGEGGAHRLEAAPPRPPLDEDQVAAVVARLWAVEGLAGCAQDMEWTVVGDDVVTLQARPVTAVAEAADDRRPWYLSLTRSLPTIAELRRRVEEEILPAMDRAADRIGETDSSQLAPSALADEIERRREVHDHWVDVYWRELIPLAHGVRLFGRLYTDVCRPEDPSEFVDLLVATPLLSVERNRRLEALAGHLRDDPGLAERVTSGGRGEAAFEAELSDFLHRFGGSAYAGERCFSDRLRLLRLLRSLAGRPPAGTAPAVGVEERVERFLARAPDREVAATALELARASYRLRDDDNLHLSRLEAAVLEAVEEGRRRLSGAAVAVDLDQVVAALRHPNLVVEPRPAAVATVSEPGFVVRARQLVGQPAGPGVAVGPARVVATADDLFDFVAGEVLVCDAVDPNMTFVAPLAAAVVERRGGMLIHGAIIAREYGLPCVTGVADATAVIATGDRVTVDGFLGVVTLGEPSGVDRHVAG